ncbi:hypothetical protein DICPUDRAFT_149262 [Dictyostelium purpureum]|uniref:protein xylosyltransferase n=1 Tax=Dictyostelium purpureum TaxID=5786 RepID=F0ZD85_DICPU|nr:uncharacterized protein DICPUDRAFT_149262 [Dictyostelium purpureum]EGC38092.1 hypothetical protein DICPUDRAFT_149262 [Dictyostelium purpureum]|eukprot:XP_003285399.1 hypothetical protein DICPUDRAFT_149262 [Dictyostelium purpureum]
MVLSLTGYYDFNISVNRNNESDLKLFFINNLGIEKEFKINYYKDILILKEKFINKIIKPIIYKYFKNNKHSLNRVIKENSGFFGQELNILFGIILQEFGLENLNLVKKCFINKNDISFHISLKVLINFKEYTIDCSKEITYDVSFYQGVLDEKEIENISILGKNELDVSIEDIIKNISNFKNENQSKNCEIKSSVEKCADAIVKDVPFGDICCWQKYRTDSNLTEMKITNNKYQTDNDKLEDILKTYGPWRETDTELLNILFEKDINNHYVLKYKDYVDLNINSYPYLCNQTENTNPIAFTILIHKIDIEAIKTLFNIYYKPFHYYVLHVDKCIKDENQINNLKNILKVFEINHKLKNRKYENLPSNILIMEERFLGTWGSITLVYMELASYGKLFDMVHERTMVTNKYSQWSHVINLSLNDMPTIPISNLTRLLCENYKTNYLEELSLKETIRYHKTHLEFSKDILHFEPMPIPDDIFELYQCGKHGIMNYYNRNGISDGTQWHILTSTYANYLIGNIKSIEKLFSFKFIDIPDEIFFQSSKVFYPQLEKEIWTKDCHRLTMWLNNPFRDDKYRYGVFINDLDTLKEGTFFVRKVYTEEVRNAIIEKFNLLEK